MPAARAVSCAILLIPSGSLGDRSTVTGTRVVAAPGSLRLRPAPDGLPDPSIQPPTVAESGDPFATLRVLDLLARVERGSAVRLDDLVDQLNATYLDWLFTPAVVADVVLQLQANWMADYRNASGVVVEDGAYGVAVTLEESSDNGVGDPFAAITGGAFTNVTASTS